MNIIYNTNLLINPKNKIYKTFKKRGFIDENGYGIKMETLRVPLIGEKIHLIQYSDLPVEIKTYLSNRNIPLVFEVVDIITTNYRLTVKNNEVKEFVNSHSVYIKVNQIDNYNVYEY